MKDPLNRPVSLDFVFRYLDLKPVRLRSRRLGGIASLCLLLSTFTTSTTMATKTGQVRFGNARFTVYSPGTIRLEYRASRDFPRTSSILTAPKLPKPCAAEVSTNANTLTITTDKLVLTFIDDGKEFNKDNLRIEHPRGHGRAVWRPGDSNEPLVQLVKSLDEWPHDERFQREEHDGMLDRLGRSCIADEAQVYRTRDNSWVDVTPLDRRGQDWWFFGYGLDFTGALRDFVNTFGRIPLVPRWVFGFWYSRWFEYSADDILDIAKKYRKAGLPMDVMVIDTEWREHHWNGYNWHGKRFPNPRELMKKLHAMGLIVPLNDHPGYYSCDPLPTNDNLLSVLKKILKRPRYKGLWACNWADQECVAVWKDRVLSKQFKDGMDFWWVDGWAEYPFNHVKGQLWLNRHYYETAEKNTKKRGLILSRWGGWGSHRFPVQFSGDTCSNWETLRNQIHFTADSCGAGACYWSHDIGGFHDKTIPDDLYIRWVQFGAFSPVFRTHSAFGTREPFAYSKLAQKVFRDVTRQRYAMIPYYYQLAREAFDTGLPICRPMYLHYPNNGPAYTNRLQYLIGRDVLVVPAFTSGKQIERGWWVPPGKWVRPETGEIFGTNGPDNRRISIPLRELPVFYRLGSIIPHQEVGEFSSQKSLDPLYLDIYPDLDSAAELDLYEDDGVTKNFETNAFTRTKFTCVRTPDSITVTAGKPRGSFPGQLKKRKVVFNIWLSPEDSVKEVLFNGKKLPKSAWRKTHTYAAGTCKGKSAFLEVTCDTDSTGGVLTIAL